MGPSVIAWTLAVVLAVGSSWSRALETENTPVRQTDGTSGTCNAPKGIPCMARDVADPGCGLDHTDALGYSGAAFRIHTLPREVLCPSTVSPRFGYIPPTVDLRSRNAVAALRQAQQLAEARQFGEYLSGTMAYDLWIQLLEASDESGLMQQQMRAHALEDAGLPTLNAYCFRALVHAREAAGPFLRRRASDVGGNASRHLEGAATCYEMAVAELKAIDKPSWTPEARKKQAAALRKAKDLEIKATALLGDALADLDKPGLPGNH